MSSYRWVIVAVGGLMGCVAIVLGLKTLPTRTINSGSTQYLSEGPSGAQSKTDTVYRYNTVKQFRNVTQYKDVDRTKVVKHVNRLVTVTNVQPVMRVNTITRVHNRTVVNHKTVNVAQARTLPTQTITSAKTIQVNHKPVHASCGC